MSTTKMVWQMVNLTIKYVGWTTAVASPFAILAASNVVFERAHNETRHQKRMKDLEYARAVEELRRLKLAPIPKPLEEV